MDSGTTGLDLPNRLLVVGDDESGRALLRAVLEPEGYEVRSLSDPAAALALIEARKVDVVVLDARATGAALDLCRRIRRDLGRLDLPVVLLSPVWDRDTRILGKDAGADEVMVKPVDPVELLARVRTLVKVKAFHDARERRAEEVACDLDRVMRELVQVERLSTSATLAAGVGHELANVASALLPTIELIRARAALGLPPEPEDLAALDQCAAHISTHGRALLRVGRAYESTTLERLDLVEAMRGGLRMLEVAGKTRHVRMHADFPEAVLPLTASRTGLEQILFNLVINAVDALRGAESPDPSVRVSLRVEGRDYVWEVEDNGPGVAADLLPRLFQPYVTSRRRSGGNGLGLAVVRRLVQDLGGRIDVVSEPGRGATFRIQLRIDG